jgi:5-methylthioribose kinase
VDYETAHFGDPTMDLGFFLSHLILKAIKQHPVHQRYFDLTRAFWQGYAQLVRFRPMPELQAEGIEHLAVCALARIDGTSPVDYLPEEAKRVSVRRIGRRILAQRPAQWEDVLELCESCLRS